MKDLHIIRHENIMSELTKINFNENEYADF